MRIAVPIRALAISDGAMLSLVSQTKRAIKPPPVAIINVLRHEKLRVRKSKLMRINANIPTMNSGSFSICVVWRRSDGHKATVAVVIIAVRALKASRPSWKTRIRIAR